MPQMQRVTGLTDGAVDLDKQEIRFTLALSGHQPLALVARFGVASQVIGALGRMWEELRQRMAPGDMDTIAAEVVAAAHIQRDRWSGNLLLQLVTDRGIPHTFAIPAREAADIAERLKTESAKDGPVGHA